MEKKPTTTYRFYEEGDGEELSRFHAEVFKVQRPPAYFTWKYLGNPENRHAMALAFKDGGVVGQIGAIGVRLKVGDEELPAGHVVDIVIKEGSRKGGTFFRLERFGLTKDIKESRIEFAFSIKTTYEIATRTLGFHGVSPIYRMVKVLNAAPYLEAKLKFGPLVKLLTPLYNAGMKLRELTGRSPGSGIIIQKVDRFDNRFDDLWQRSKSQYEIMIARTSDYLRWRFSEHPTLRYSIYGAFKDGVLKGYVVLGSRQKGEASGVVVEIEVDTAKGFIADILVAPGTDQEVITRALIRRAVAHFRAQKMDSVACWVLRHMDLRRILEQLGFFERETPHDLIVRSNEPERYPTEYLIDPTRWYIARGDSDYE
ncbi:MAG: hypothetical protein Kow0099_14430 [Candidatus Abyssubacteria bacterium]